MRGCAVLDLYLGNGECSPVHGTRPPGFPEDRRLNVQLTVQDVVSLFRIERGTGCARRRILVRRMSLHTESLFLPRRSQETVSLSLSLQDRGVYDAEIRTNSLLTKSTNMQKNVDKSKYTVFFFFLKKKGLCLREDALLEHT